jgi:hypothetical protein
MANVFLGLVAVVRPEVDLGSSILSINTLKTSFPRSRLKLPAADVLAMSWGTLPP